MEAIKLMDEGKLDASIVVLEESEKLDPTNFNYPYEIALAYVFKKDYKNAIKKLKKAKKYENVTSQLYQLLGNSYSLLGNRKKALSSYDEGLKKFPNAGNLYLERGNIFYDGKDYNEAVLNYEKGIEVNPEYSSNYFRAADLFLRSTNKVPGLIYGELFMNLERTTGRTKEMSQILFKAYEESISLSKDSSSVDFCEIVIDITDLSPEEIKLPYCAIFGKNFALAIIDQTEISLKNLSMIRSNFIDFYFKEDSKDYPNLLFDYHKKMKDATVFNGYNYYLLQIGNEEEFNRLDLA